MTWQTFNVVGEDGDGNEAIVRAGVNSDQIALIIKSDTEGRTIFRLANGDEIEVMQDTKTLYDMFTDDYWFDDDPDDDSDDDDDDTSDDDDDIPFAAIVLEDEDTEEFMVVG